MSEPVVPLVSMSAADIDESDVQAVLEVLRSGRLALGPRAEEFERALADYVGVRHAVAMNSGTAALHVAVEALGIGPGDEVLVPSFTFAASVNAIFYRGATPVFVDIEPESYNLDPEDLERKITPQSRAVMVVDVFGHPAEWERIAAIAGRRRLALVDDSCEALGASYRGVRLGRFGDVAAFAFYPNKQITTGEGGMLVTDDDSIAALARSLRNQGRGEMGAWVEHERLGYNYRMDEMSAALGASQLRRLPALLAERERVARLYTERLAGSPDVRPPVVKAHVTMSWFVYVVTLAAGLRRDPLMAAMEARGIPVRGYFQPLHRQRYVEARVGRAVSLPVTDSVAERTVALPFHGRMSAAEVERVVGVLDESIAEQRAGARVQQR